MPADGQVKAREYLRVSRDKSGRVRSNDEQAEDNRRVWQGWEWGEHYSDATSASRYGTKPRDDWGDLLADLESGEFAADVLVVWLNDRGSRQVGEWVTLLDLCEKRGVRIAVTEHERVYDPTIPRDRKSLIDDANDAEYMVAKQSGALKRAFRANAAAGRPHGRVPFGYRRVYDERTGQLVGQEPHPDEAPIVAELFDRIVKGHSLRSITRDFEQRGIVAKTGLPFSHYHLRTTLQRPLYVGKRVHAPHLDQGLRSAADLHDEKVTVTDAEWDAIVDESVFWQVQEILADPKRKTSRPGAARHLLSHIVPCHVCDGPLSMLHPEGERWYRCTNGHLRVSADALDAYATEKVLAFLARPDAYELLSDGSDDAELEEVRAAIAKVRHALAELETTLNRREISPKLAGAAEARYEADLERLERRERELTTPSQLVGIIEPGEDVAHRWKDLPMPAKRTVMKLLLSRELLGELRVTRAPRRVGKWVPVAERVVWRRAAE